MAWIMLTAFSQVNGDNWERRAEQKDWQFGQKRSAFKVVDRRVWLLKRLAPLERNQVLCIRIIGKMSWEHLRDWPDPI
jgi:hypothetical protein